VRLPHRRAHVFAVCRRRERAIEFGEMTLEDGERDGDDGYRSGTVLGGTGYLRVKVAPAGATVEYVDMRAAGSPGRLADRYVLRPSDRAAKKRP
jgi:hypothetical protein